MLRDDDPIHQEPRAFLLIAGDPARARDALDAALADRGWIVDPAPFDGTPARRLEIRIGASDRALLAIAPAGHGDVGALDGLPLSLSSTLRVRAASLTETSRGDSYEEWTSGQSSLGWDEANQLRRLVELGQRPRPTDEHEIPALLAGRHQERLRRGDVFVEMRFGVDRLPETTARLYRHRTWSPWAGEDARRADAHFGSLLSRVWGGVEISRLGRIIPLERPSGGEVLAFHPYPSLIEALNVPGFPIALDDPFLDRAVQALISGDDDVPLGDSMLLFKRRRPARLEIDTATGEPLEIPARVIPGMIIGAG